MNTQKQIFLMVVFLFLITGGCAAYTAIDLPVRAGRQADFFQKESIERGALLYANNCRTCHGIRGEGGVGLTLNKPSFQNQDPLALAQNQDLIRRTLYCGRAGTLMPAWLEENGGSLTANQIEHLVRLMTAPVDEDVLDEFGNPSNEGWLAAVEFAHNLNREATAVVTGDSLDSIASAHGVGPREIAELNGVAVDEELEEGEEIRLPIAEPATVEAEDGDTATKIAERWHVGAVLIAELNGIEYELTDDGDFFLPYDGDDETLVLDPEGERETTGLLPGEELELPTGATYLVRVGDTLQSVAELHGISVSELRDLNEFLLGGFGAEDQINASRSLFLPDGAAYIVTGGETLDDIAELYAIAGSALADVNELDVDAELVTGQEIALLDGLAYFIQDGDTVASIADGHVGVSEAELRALNELAGDEEVTPEVILELPKIDAYVVQARTLDETAGDFANVSAASLAERNEIDVEAALPVGKILHLPLDAWGSNPPDQINPGLACVQHTVPQSVFDTITGAEPVEITKPEEVSSDVVIQAHANDWTVVADGDSKTPNESGVTVEAGTDIVFDNLEGLHTITIDGEKQGEDILQGETRSITFSQPGEFTITCDYHPDMLAKVFVE